MKPVPRQSRAVRIISVALAIPLTAALATSAGELSRHGFSFFVFRQAGTGASRGDAPPFAPPKPSGPPQVTIAVPVTPSAYVLYPVPGLAHRKTVTVTMTVGRDELIMVVGSIPPAAAGPTPSPAPEAAP